MENLERYKHLNKYLKDKFGERTLKICIDGGFSCPNRDGSISNGGCIFCSERGSGDHIKFCSNSHTIENFISDQVKNYFTIIFTNFFLPRFTMSPSAPKESAL